MKDNAIQLEQITGTIVLKPVVKIVKDSQGKIVQGLKIGATQAQNEALILIANAGEFKNAPRLGVGLSSAVLSETDDMLKYKHAVRSNYRWEGLAISKLKMKNINNIEIEAKYI